jgi:hypothetical protein
MGKERMADRAFHPRHRGQLGAEGVEGRMTNNREEHEWFYKKKGNPKWINTYIKGLLVLTNKITGKSIYCPIDEIDIPKINKYQWQPLFCNSTNSYYIRTAYKNENGKYISGSLHRIILNVKDKNVKVDHINHDTLDNTRKNIRCISQRGNCCNNIRNTSGFPGVFWSKLKKKWRVYITVNRIQTSFGSFNTKEDAALRLFNVGKKLFGKNSPYKDPRI